MNSIIKSPAGLISLLEDSFDKNGLPKPFVSEIFLIQTHVAGTTHVKIEEIEPELNVNDFLIFGREPGNKYDKLAIMISDKNGRKLGYVPMEKNEILARLMDAGKMVFGQVAKKEWHGAWLKVDMKVFMRDF